MKKLTNKQKQHIKDIAKKVGIGLSVAFNVIFVFILIASLVYSAKGNKASDTVHTEIIKTKPNKAYSIAKSYTGNIITSPKDIADNDILGGVYGVDVQRSPYLAFCNFQFELDTSYTAGTRYYAPYSVSSYTINHNIFFNADGTYQGTDYDFVFNMVDREGALPNINGRRVNFCTFKPISDVRCELWLNYNYNNQTYDLRYIIFNNSVLPYGYSSSNNGAFLSELFSGKYYYTKLNGSYSDLDVYRYKGLISTLSQYSVHYLDVKSNDVLKDSMSLYPIFRSYGYTPLFTDLGCYIVYKPTSTQLDENGNVFILYGDFYYNGECYNDLRLYYDRVHVVSNTNVDYYIYVNGNEVRKLSFSNSQDILYLSSVVLGSNVYGHQDLNIGFPCIYSTGRSWSISSIDYPFVIKALVNTKYFVIDNQSTYYSDDYNYNLVKGLFTFDNQFYFNYNGGSPYWEIYGVANDNGIGNGTTTLTEVFVLINNGLIGLTGLFDYAILPGISIGLLIALPITFSVLLFVIKLFKR